MRTLAVLALPGLLAIVPATYAGESYRQVSRILAQHCLECHGPDAEQRRADLRLDERDSATSKRESGLVAIVPGAAHESELIRRIIATDESRMPPADAGRRLSEEEINLLTTWIQDGARWQTHWAFLAPQHHEPPHVDASQWIRQPLDRFILRKIEDAQSAGHLNQVDSFRSSEEFTDIIQAADRRTLIRRVYFDLIGLPPTPQQVLDFQNDESPDAWIRVIDELLASPMYGQRWGRRWLDVVRYADSNGSDENHAYPLAWRFRNYVIDSFNEDLSFDQFVREQLAGDMLTDRNRSGQALTATGFLAIGTKILAEQDPAKKQADIVDEQIDTIGKALLGFTVACARCHDHKFDPIPTRDYYALAGILHSTRLEDLSLETPAYSEALARHTQQLAELTTRRERLKDSLVKNGSNVLDRQAESYERGNAVKLDSGYGQDIGIIGDPGAQLTWAEWDFNIDQKGPYLVQFRYAAKTPRKGTLSINGKIVSDSAVDQQTGGWHPEHQKWLSEGSYLFESGRNTVRFESEPLMSHIDRIRLVRSDGERSTRILAGIDRVEAQLTELSKQAPQPTKVMAVADGDPRDVPIHLRGSHLTPGNIVARGFPMIAAAKISDQSTDEFQINDTTSGRLQLANWITDPNTGAGRQLSRVFVNRVWQWHFGRAIAPSPNNLGLQGELPSHPELLDWLAIRFIEDGWSVKALHRRILSSATYRQQTTANTNRYFAGYARQRMQAEVLRDTLLFHAGRLDTSPAGHLDGITSQNPSPDDLRRNEELHRNSNKRSVYLPVVRSNVYRFFALFDFPNSTTSVGKRDLTTVPTQALLMMNDPFLMDQAERCANQILKSQGDQAVITELYSRLFNRPPTVAERTAAEEFVASFSDTLGKETPTPEAWSALCHTLMSSSEFVYVE